MMLSDEVDAHQDHQSERQTEDLVQVPNQEYPPADQIPVDEISIGPISLQNPNSPGKKSNQNQSIYPLTIRTKRRPNFLIKEWDEGESCEEAKELPGSLSTVRHRRMQKAKGVSNAKSLKSQIQKTFWILKDKQTDNIFKINTELLAPGFMGELLVDKSIDLASIESKIIKNLYCTFKEFEDDVRVAWWKAGIPYPFGQNLRNLSQNQKIQACDVVVLSDPTEQEEIGAKQTKSRFFSGKTAKKCAPKKGKISKKSKSSKKTKKSKKIRKSRHRKSRKSKRKSHRRHKRNRSESSSSSRSSSSSSRCSRCSSSSDSESNSSSDSSDSSEQSNSEEGSSVSDSSKDSPKRKKQKGKEQNQTPKETQQIEYTPEPKPLTFNEKKRLCMQIKQLPEDYMWDLVNIIKPDYNAEENSSFVFNIEDLDARKAREVEKHVQEVFKKFQRQMRATKKTRSSTITPDPFANQELVDKEQTPSKKKNRKTTEFEEDKLRKRPEISPEDLDKVGLGPSLPNVNPDATNSSFISDSDKSP